MTVSTENLKHLNYANAAVRVNYSINFSYLFFVIIYQAVHNRTRFDNTVLFLCVSNARMVAACLEQTSQCNRQQPLLYVTLLTEYTVGYIEFSVLNIKLENSINWT